MADIPLILTVISDLHCKHSSSDKQNGISQSSTILYSDALRTDTTPRHPVHSLLQEVEKNKEIFRSDLLLCPGDITDKIDHQGYITGWSFLEEIKQSLEACELYATLGNHDVDSRRINSSELPFFVARSIKYSYPINDKNLQEKYWNDHFCIVNAENYILLIFNSVYSHISSSDSSKAKISEEIITKMDQGLKSLGATNKPKIALCHHHPLNHSNVSYPDSDIIDKGELFLDMLNNHDFSIVIHGHKHEIKLRYYNNILVFCAGSFSSLENLRETESNNVFHQIHVFPNKKGLIKTWVYGARSGWSQKKDKNFPAVCGFGYHGQIPELAQRVSIWFSQHTNNRLELYKKLISIVPEVELLLPYQQQLLEEELRNLYEIEIMYDTNGIPVKVSKLITND